MHFDTDALQGQAHRFMPKHLISDIPQIVVNIQP